MKMKEASVRTHKVTNLRASISEGCKGYFSQDQKSKCGLGLSESFINHLSKQRKSLKANPPPLMKEGEARVIHTGSSRSEVQFRLIPDRKESFRSVRTRTNKFPGNNQDTIHRVVSNSRLSQPANNVLEDHLSEQTVSKEIKDDYSQVKLTPKIQVNESNWMIHNVALLDANHSNKPSQKNLGKSVEDKANANSNVNGKFGLNLQNAESNDNNINNTKGNNSFQKHYDDQVNRRQSSEDVVNNQTEHLDKKPREKRLLERPVLPKIKFKLMLTTEEFQSLQNSLKKTLAMESKWSRRLKLVDFTEQKVRKGKCHGDEQDDVLHARCRGHGEIGSKESRHRHRHCHFSQNCNKLNIDHTSKKEVKSSRRNKLCLQTSKDDNKLLGTQRINYWLTDGWSPFFSIEK